MQLHETIMWLPILLTYMAWYFPPGVSGLLPDKGPIDVIVCDNTSFTICWAPTDNPSGYCSFLRNSFGTISDNTYHPRPEDSSSMLDYTFGRLNLISTYKGCVVPVQDLVRDDEGCIPVIDGGQNVSCVSYTPDLGFNLQNGLAIGCTGYLLLMYVLLRLANIFCPYSRKNLSYEDFFLHGEGEQLSRRSRRNRGTEQRRTNSIRERARKRSEAISEGLTSPPRSPRSPSTLSEISETIEQH